MNAVTGIDDHSSHAHYFFRRVVDALLREDVHECVSQAQVMIGDDAAFAHRFVSELMDGQWLVLRHLGNGRLWVPVQRCHFMQDWRLRDAPLIWEHDDGVDRLQRLDDVLARFKWGMPPDDAHRLTEFSAECRTAMEHREKCNQALQRYTRTWRKAGDPSVLDRFDWATRMLHYEQLAAFQDHPFYPTARAKLGFSGMDLEHYAPEFQPAFRLRWLAVPRQLYSGDIAPGPWWPTFARVGLDPALGASHALLPVHPFMWDRLHDYLDNTGLNDHLVRAPLPYLEVRPTLSVRTVVPTVAPRWHIKLPLPIRTLGARNVRTIKPSTIHDGQLIQGMLADIAAGEPAIRNRLLLTDEGLGAHVAQEACLGFIVRRYPNALDDAHLVPVAALHAPTPDGRLVVERLAEKFFGADVLALLDAYLDLTLRVHLLLWIRYGIALESNQQNSVIVFSEHEPRLRLLLKDNDAGRVHGGMLAAHGPLWRARLDSLQDRRIVVNDALPLAQMFSTITLQLNLAVLVEALAAAGYGHRDDLYAQVREKLMSALGELDRRGASTAFARRILLADEHLYIKYLLRAATLESKDRTGAADVNKFYGKTAPNFLRKP